MLPSQYLLRGLTSMPMIVVFIMGLAASVVIYYTNNPLIKKITCVGLSVALVLMLTINVVTLYKSVPPKKESRLPDKKKEENVYFFNCPDTKYRESIQHMLPPIE